MNLTLYESPVGVSHSCDSLPLPADKGLRQPLLHSAVDFSCFVLADLRELVSHHHLAIRRLEVERRVGIWQRRLSLASL